MQPCSSSTCWSASPVGSTHCTIPSFISITCLQKSAIYSGVMLDDDDGLAVVLVQFPQHRIDLIRVLGVQLSNRLIQNQNFRLQRNRTGQCQQMGLPTGQLPDKIILFSLQSALPNACSPRSR